MSKPTREELRAELERNDKISEARSIVWNEGFTMDERLDALEYLVEVGVVELN